MGNFFWKAPSTKMHLYSLGYSLYIHWVNIKYKYTSETCKRGKFSDVSTKNIFSKFKRGPKKVRYSLHVTNTAHLHCQTTQFWMLPYVIHTALRNHNRTVFEEMTSWTSLTLHIGMETAFQTKHIKSKYVRIFIANKSLLWDTLSINVFLWDSPSIKFIMRHPVN